MLEIGYNVDRFLVGNVAGGPGRNNVVSEIVPVRLAAIF